MSKHVSGSGLDSLLPTIATLVTETRISCLTLYTPLRIFIILKSDEANTKLFRILHFVLFLVYCTSQVIIELIVVAFGIQLQTRHVTAISGKG